MIITTAMRSSSVTCLFGCLFACLFEDPVRRLPTSTVDFIVVSAHHRFSGAGNEESSL